MTKQELIPIGKIFLIDDATYSLSQTAACLYGTFPNLFESPEAIENNQDPFVQCLTKPAEAMTNILNAAETERALGRFVLVIADIMMSLRGDVMMKNTMLRASNTSLENNIKVIYISAVDFRKHLPPGAVFLDKRDIVIDLPDELRANYTLMKQAHTAG